MIEIGIPCKASDKFALDAALDAIAAAMLWPKKKDQASSFVLDRYLRRQNDLCLNDCYLIEQSRIKSISKGYIAGFVLRNAITKLRLGETFKLSNFKSVFEEMKLFGHSTKTVDNDVWPTFRGVSPLWASQIILVETGAVKSGVFPCFKESISEFVGIAECLKKEGEARTPRSRERTLLKNADGYVLSDAIIDAVLETGSDSNRPNCRLASLRS